MSNSNSIQVVILGEATVGKTSIVNRLLKSKFDENTHATIGASYSCEKLEDIKYCFWDTAGQERYLSLVPMYYRKGDIILLVFDTSRLSTIDRIVHYLEKIRQDMTIGKYEVILIGNKLDLATCSTEHINNVLEEKLDNFDDILGDKIDCLYVSSKNTTGFETLVSKLKEKGRIMYDIKFNVKSEDTDSNNKIINLNDSQNNSGYVNKLSCGYC